MTIQNEKTQAQRDRLKQITEEALATLCESLEQGKSDQLIQYLDTMSRFPKYSFRNLILIVSQMPDAKCVMGYQSWKRIGRYVRKGEKAIRIWAPMTVKNKERVQSDSAPKDGESEPTLIFRPVCVWDQSQTDGKSLPEFEDVSGDPGEYLERLKGFAENKGIKIGYDSELRVDGVSRCGEILIRLGLDLAQEFHVLAHEIAHSLIHFKENRKRLSKKQVETEAEAVAYVVSKSIGLKTGTASSDYIQLYHGDKETVSESLTVIQQTATQITGALIQ